MTAQWSGDQTAWPAHLRDDAPSQQCGRCGRFTRSLSEFGTECRMPQPDGYPCGGRFEPPSILLHLYTADLGAPIPTDTTTPLPEEYQWVGRGWVRLSRPEPQDIHDLLTRAVVGNPQLLVRWDERHANWQSPGTWRDPVTMKTIIGHTVGDDGTHVRMVAHRAGRIEDELHRGGVTTTIDLHTSGPDGGVVTWYWRP